MMILIQTFGKCVKKQTYVVIKMTLIVNEIIDTLNDLKQFTFDKENEIIYIQIDNKLFTINDIVLNENKNLILKCEYTMEE